MVSVIIPIYNVEKYIDRGLACILNQTYQDYEIILVDDGSTDGSLKQCTIQAEKNPCIKVFHKANGGAGSARNLGIEKSSGEYVYFFDIDDLAEIGLLEYCVSTMDNSAADMMVFSYRNKDDSSGQEYEIVMNDIIISSNEELREIYVDQFIMKMNGFPWNKMYRKSFLNKYHLRFEDLLIQQDEVFNLGIYPFITKVVLSSKILYTYFVYNKGNTRSRFIPQRFEIYKTVNQRFLRLMDFWKLEDNRMVNYMYQRLWSNTVSGLLQNLNSDYCSWSIREKQDEIDRIAKDPCIMEAIAKLRLKSSFEQRLYMKAIQKRSLVLLLYIHIVFDMFREINRRARRIITGRCSALNYQRPIA